MTTFHNLFFIWLVLVEAIATRDLALRQPLDLHFILLHRQNKLNIKSNYIFNRLIPCTLSPLISKSTLYRQTRWIYLWHVFIAYSSMLAHLCCVCYITTLSLVQPTEAATGLWGVLVLFPVDLMSAISNMWVILDLHMWSDGVISSLKLKQTNTLHRSK